VVIKGDEGVQMEEAREQERWRRRRHQGMPARGRADIYRWAYLGHGLTLPYHTLGFSMTLSYRWVTPYVLR
jgi:hypothetical protein